jgi:hypothetical protein
MSNQEIQRVAEFNVFERNLYQMPQRAPLRNGILDTRMVRRACASRKAADGVGRHGHQPCVCIKTKSTVATARDAGHD